jgi:hypothetical protein
MESGEIFLNRRLTFWFMASVVLLLVFLSYYVIESPGEEQLKEFYSPAIIAVTDIHFYFEKDPVAISDIGSVVGRFEKRYGLHQVLPIKAAHNIKCETIFMLIKEICHTGHQEIGLATKIKYSNSYKIAQTDKLLINPECHEHQAIILKIIGAENSLQSLQIESNPVLPENLIFELKRRINKEPDKGLCIQVSSELYFNQASDILNAIWRSVKKEVCLSPIEIGTTASNFK